MSDDLNQLIGEKQNIFNDDPYIDSDDIDESGPQGRNDLIQKKNMQEMEILLVELAG
jgi:hypothetical protein